MSTAVGAPTNYAELTIGGVISANGHGTGSNVTSSMGDITLEFTWVDAQGNVHTSSRNSPEGHGLAGGALSHTGSNWRAHTHSLARSLGSRLGWQHTRTVCNLRELCTALIRLHGWISSVSFWNVNTWLRHSGSHSGVGGLSSRCLGACVAPFVNPKSLFLERQLQVVWV